VIALLAESGVAPAASAFPRCAGGPEFGARVSSDHVAATQETVEPLLPRIADGDQDAVPTFLDRYDGLVWSLARRLLPNRADAEEAVQEIFVDIWKNASRFDEALGSETTFVAMIARRRLIDKRRRLGRAPATASINDTAPPRAVDERADATDNAEEAKRALSALDQLKPEQQEVLRLAVVQGLSHTQVAEATGMPLGTVKTHVRRGLMRIREALERQGADVDAEGFSS